MFLSQDSIRKNETRGKFIAKNQLCRLISVLFVAEAFYYFAKVA